MNIRQGNIIVTGFGEFEATGKSYTEKISTCSPWGDEIRFYEVVTDTGLNDIDEANIIAVKIGNSF